MAFDRSNVGRRSITMEELISIIVPVYGVEEYLDKCVLSIINQTYRNIEIFLVDDGSLDRCPGMCDEWAKNDSRIKVIHKKNGGQGSARNMALDLANGEYICFVDSDDSLKPDCIDFLYRLLISNNLDVSACNIDLYDENGDFIRKRLNGDGYLEYSNIAAIESLWVQGPINIGPWAKLYKKSLWKDIRFKECFAEDLATMHNVYEKANIIGYSYESKLNYLVRKSSDIRSFQDKKMIMSEIVEDNILFCEKYPELINAAKQKAASVYFHLLFQMPDNSRYDEQKKVLIRKIKRLRFSVLMDKKCIKKTKYALLCSYLGFDFTRYIFLKIKKNDSTF